MALISSSGIRLFLVFFLHNALIFFSAIPAEMEGVLGFKGVHYKDCSGMFRLISFLLCGANPLSLSTSKPPLNVTSATLFNGIVNCSS